MDPALVAALKAGWPIVHLVGVEISGYSIRWSTGGFQRWNDEVWNAHDDTYGAIDEIGEITDGIDDDASPVQIVIIPPDLTSLEALASADAQGGWVEIWLACVDPDTGAVVAPYRLTVGELDQPRLRTGKVRKLEYDIISGDARGLQPNEEQRQTDAFRQYVWPGERGDEYATDGTKQTYWREDEPRSAIGVLTGRGNKEIEDKAIQFTYEPNAPLAFPFGRCGYGGDIRYRVGYGPTNRWQSVFATFGASGPIRSLVKATFDDEATSFDGNDRATNGSHAREMWFQYNLGEQPAEALTSPTGSNAHSSPAPGWTSAHKLSGRPAFVWTGKENSKQSEYRGGIPKPVLTVEGLFGFDPFEDGCDITQTNTWPWINDGGMAALNWVIGRWEGQADVEGNYGVPYQSVLVGGIGAPYGTIDVDAFNEVRNIAVANGWTMAGVVFSDQDKNDVLEDMLKAAGAVPARKCGMISAVSFGAPRASTLTATEADTAAAPIISLAPSRLDRNNTGVPSFYSEDNRFEMTSIASVSNPDWVSADGGRNTDGYEFRYVDQADQAAQLCYLALANEREGVQASVTLMPWMMQLEPGHTFEWAAPEYLLDGTKVRVRKRTWDPSSCLVKIDFREETDAKYADAFVQTGSPPPGYVPNPPPVNGGGAVDTPLYRDPTYPLTSDEDSITVAAHTAFMITGDEYELPAAVLTGLDDSTLYWVFWKPDVGYEVEPDPALTRLTAGGWILVGQQYTPDAEGGFPEPPEPPPGHCAQEDEPLLLANEDHTGPGGTIRVGDAVAGETWVWTRHEKTGAWGAFLITAVSRRQSELVALVMRDGRAPKFSPLHRVGLANGRFRRLGDLCCGIALDGTGAGTVDHVEPAGTGWVIRLSVDDAATYVIDGLLSHNVKMDYLTEL